MPQRHREPDFPFVVLTALFLAALVVCNLVASKFATVDLGFKVFELSAGALPYPVTFLVTDLLSEIYGKRRANQVVWSGLVASVFVLGVLWLGDQFPAVTGSKVSNEAYRAVFKGAPNVIAASMTAYLLAQLLDVRLFHFWKNLTNGHHLWLRNNASTIVSQLADSVLVVLVLYWGDVEWPAQRIVSTIGDLWLFKLLVALLDTPLLYAGVWVFDRWPPSRDGPAA